MTEERQKKQRPQSELELATMRHCRRLIQRLNDGKARERVVSYLQSSVFEEDGEPPPYEDPRQERLPLRELPFG